MEKRRNQAVEIAVNTFEALVLERGDSGKIWASVLKEAIKRRKPDFSESYYGFRTFGNLIEECKARGHLEFGRDEKSGAYVYRGSGVPQPASEAPAVVDGAAPAVEGGQQESRRSRNRGRTAAERFAERQAQRQAQQQRGAPAQQDGAAAAPAEPVVAETAAPVAETAPVVLEAAVELPAEPPVEAVAPVPPKKKNGAKPPARKLKSDAKKARPEAAPQEAVVAPVEIAPVAPVVAEPVAAPAPVDAPAAKPAKAAKAKPAAKAGAKPKAKPAEDGAKPARKPAARTPRPPKAAKPAEE
jgi:hypothetical protein